MTLAAAGVRRILLAPHIRALSSLPADPRAFVAAELAARRMTLCRWSRPLDFDAASAHEVCERDTTPHSTGR